MFECEDLYTPGLLPCSSLFTANPVDTAYLFEDWKTPPERKVNANYFHFAFVVANEKLQKVIGLKPKLVQLRPGPSPHEKSPH